MPDIRTNTSPNANQRIAEEGKYLTFKLGEEDYGVEILKVREIIGIMDITFVPRLPSYVKGVINLRGKVIPVIDLRSKFAMEEIVYTQETCIIVMSINDVLIGMIIDKVEEVLSIPQNDIEPTPNFGINLSTDFILGIGKVSQKTKILLNIDKILGDDMKVV